MYTLNRRTEAAPPVTFQRDEFINERWKYQPGEHVTFIGYTGSGKTMLAYQLLQKTTNPDLPGVVLVMKPEDDTVEEWSKRLKYKVTRDWPPPPRLPFTDPPSGYVVWPQHVFDPDIDDPRHHDVFRRTILANYKRGNRVIFGDELYSLCEELKLKKPLITVWSKGRSMHAGVWGATQRPAYVPLWAYSQADHLFLAYESDDRARQRFREIGGVNSRLVSDVVIDLYEHQWLYINRTAGRPTMCIIQPTPARDGVIYFNKPENTEQENIV